MGHLIRNHDVGAANKMSEEKARLSLYSEIAEINSHNAKSNTVPHTMFLLRNHDLSYDFSIDYSVQLSNPISTRQSPEMSFTKGVAAIASIALFVGTALTAVIMFLGSANPGMHFYDPARPPIIYEFDFSNYA